MQETSHSGRFKRYENELYAKMLKDLLSKTFDPIPPIAKQLSGHYFCKNSVSHCNIEMSQELIIINRGFGDLQKTSLLSYRLASRGAEVSLFCYSQVQYWAVMSAQDQKPPKGETGMSARERRRKGCSHFGGGGFGGRARASGRKIGGCRSRDTLTYRLRFTKISNPRHANNLKSLHPFAWP